MAKGKKTGGRKAGTPNVVTTDIAALAREYGPLCIAVLADIAVTGDPADSARAATALLNRGYGQAPQALSVSMAGNINIRLTSYSGRDTGRPELIVPRTGATTNGGALIEGTTAANGSGHPPPE